MAAQASQLVMAVHTVEAATAKVPFSMILLLDHAKRKSIPEIFKLRMVIPSDGLVSVSLWDIAAGDSDELLGWLSENLGGDCITQVQEVQEEFTWGVTFELARLRASEKVAGRSRQTIDAIGERTTKAAELVAAGVSTAVESTHQKLEEWDKRTGVISNAKTTTAATYTKISAVVAKAAENERVQDVAAVVQSGWKSVTAGLGILGERVARMATNDAAGGAAAGPPPPYSFSGGQQAASGQGQAPPPVVQPHFGISSPGHTPVEPTYAPVVDSLLLDDDGPHSTLAPSQGSASRAPTAGAPGAATNLAP